MANKTIYVRDEDLSIWEAAQTALEVRGESISKFLVECLRKRLKQLSLRDGFLHVLRSEPGSEGGRCVVLFAPVDVVGGAMRPHYCQGQKALIEFLRGIGIEEDHVEGIIGKIHNSDSDSLRVSLPQDRIDLF